MNIFSHYKYFDFDLLERHLNLNELYCNVNFVDSSGDLELVYFNKEHFFVEGFIFFRKITNNIYEFEKIRFRSDYNFDFLKKFVGISLSPTAIEYLRDKRIIDFD